MNSNDGSGNKPGSGGRGGYGMSGYGMGGTSPNGYGYQGHMDHLLPVYGPSRLEFGEAGLAYGEYGSGKKVSRRKKAKVNANLTGSQSETGGDSVQQAVSVPEKYKKAVMQYFTDQEN